MKYDVYEGSVAKEQSCYTAPKGAHSEIPRNSEMYASVQLKLYAKRNIESFEIPGLERKDWLRTSHYFYFTTLKAVLAAFKPLFLMSSNDRENNLGTRDVTNTAAKYLIAPIAKVLGVVAAIVGAVLDIVRNIFSPSNRLKDLYQAGDSSGPVLPAANTQALLAGDGGNQCTFRDLAEAECLKHYGEVVAVENGSASMQG